ncbi:hypothetical protein EDD17DRAFT_880748 [Pisolithus thermaeus]|nr:hypothetical protein EDD17DRAFT_880748 [Pisolithus thermaeus]
MLNLWVNLPSRVETILRSALEQRLSSTVATTGRKLKRIYTVYLIGADGTRGMTRKQLGLTFLGTTRERNFLVVEDIHLEVKIEITHTSSVRCRKIYAVSYDTQLYHS